MSAVPELELIEGFYDQADCRQLLKRLLDEQDWPNNRYQVGERWFELPRQQTWHADPGIRYSYSNNLLVARPWTPLLSELRTAIEHRLNAKFNAVLVNLYRDGNDYVGWHSDNEREMGDEPLIASLSLGATRTFAYRHKRSGEQGSTRLNAGTLLTMRPSFQHDWRHSLPPAPEVADPRINLTFRYVLPPPN
ncbi:alpha-ketoglutarate-dependent dioxygenase AlkB family protein [Methylomonas sp. MED-D]|uniref:alpha-ketoglutarate-dependent dioxygenase AlkB family protein n=1 Tax=unclassified Methylomonas TaxID=2608980 RepID=UPI0028A49A57|nr:alpha-ketoglutarate-dependent dioxygenase AlkB [Methylomonas sp. MV1]MDT4331584.1 alpha-ketoglutarate-dependent dioxygenase AlkB [Methylomonas sp. MV1]